MSFDYDILDATKIIPEEEVPVEAIGKLMLNRNPDNYFAETEQVAFSVGHIVPGMDFTNDPLLQGRLSSYLDTQMLRLGGPNFHEILINRPVCPFANNQRDSFHRQTINTGQASYEPNSIDDGQPTETPSGPERGGFESVNEKIDAHKIRARSDSFAVHYSQARLFWNSQTPVEQEHIIQAYTFELSKVERRYIRERVIQNILPNISMDLARAVGEMHGIDVPNEPPASEKEYGRGRTEKPAALSLMACLPGNIKHRKVAILAADGVDAGEITEIKNKLIEGGATPLVITPSMAALTAANGETVESDAMLNGLPSVTMDVVIVHRAGRRTKYPAPAPIRPGVYYLQEAYKHLKVIAAVSQGSELVEAAGLDANEEGVLSGERVGDVFGEFCEHLGRHCVWSRNDKANRVPA